MQYDTAVSFLRNLQALDIRLDVCKINPLSEEVLKLTKYLELTGSPDTEKEAHVLFSELSTSILGEGNKKLAISAKIFLGLNPEGKYDEDDRDDELSFRYEASLYRYITEKILDPGYSPNFVAFVAFGCCADTDLRLMVPGGTFTTLKSVLTNYSPKNNVCILITERAGNGKYFGEDKMYYIRSLAELKDDIQPPYPEEFDTIFFQLAYSLAVMQRFRIVHNDLHANNVLVACLDYPIEMYFSVSGEQEIFYKITTAFIPYIFDWDLGFCEALGDNPKLKHFKHLNLNNRFTELGDLYTLLCTMVGGEEVKDEYGVVSKHMREPGMVISEMDKRIFPVSEEVLNRIRSLEPYIPSDDNPGGTGDVYKMGQAQFRDLIPDPDNVLPKIYNSVMFRVASEDPPAIKISNQFPCRAASYGKRFPTPIQLLENEFRLEYSIPKEEFLEAKRNNPSHTFSMPPPSVFPDRRIHIDPVHAKRGRSKVERPRFPPQKSGYIARREKSPVKYLPL